MGTDLNRNWGFHWNDGGSSSHPCSQVYHGYGPFSEVENRLLTGGCRRKVLSILKTLHDNHLDLPGNPITSYILKTLVLYECEKHPREFEWDESAIGDRINGILLQLISCLQCKRCPHYFLPTLDLFKGKSPSAMENASKQVWRLLRELLTNTRALEKL